MTEHRTAVLADTYVDSVVQMAGTRTMRAVEGVEWAAAAMGTPANVGTLAGEGFAGVDAGANDLVLAVRAGDGETADAALDAAREAMFTRRDRGGGAVEEADPGSLVEAVALEPGANVAVVSVPGDYAPLAAHQALSAGLHVLLFSDNVPVDAEVELKERAAGLGLLVMGPGAGTAMLGGVCLGFANVVTAGRVGVVAAAGTGAQEAAALLDRWGVGVSQVVGLGGRDLTSAVGGLMARPAVRALAADPGTDLVLGVSKPPDPEVARAVLAEAGDTPMVAAFVGLAGQGSHPTIEGAVLAALDRLGRPRPDPAVGLVEAVGRACAGLDERRTVIRGLYSGGTLCYEALVVLTERVGPVYSNTPLSKDSALPAPDGAHTCLDLGEEEYTKGRPHPMIDPAARIEMLREQAAEPDVAVLVLDVVLGYGAHDDPAAELAPVCAEVMAAGGPRVVVYVLGTESDPQGYSRQKAAFAEAGCLVTETAARAALAAAAIATRDPQLAGARL